VCRSPSLSTYLRRWATRHAFWSTCPVSRVPKPHRSVSSEDVRASTAYAARLTGEKRLSPPARARFSHDRHLDSDAFNAVALDLASEGALARADAFRAWKEMGILERPSGTRDGEELPFPFEPLELMGSRVYKGDA
jgi:hypothetical protein